MHRIALCLTLVSATASAEIYIADNPRFEDAPSGALAVGFANHDSQLGGLHETGIGATFEAALGHDRTQFFLELDVLSTKIDDTSTMVGPRGTFGRGGLGARWLARQYQPEREFGIELFLEAVAGVERFWWNDGGLLTRPDLGIGVGMQIRAWEIHNLTFRSDARVLFAPNDRESSLIACRGTGCPTGSAGSVAGMLLGVAVGW